MDDKQLDRSLRSIGKKCFVDYYDKFCDSRLSNSDLIELLMKKEGYEESGCKTRVTQSRRIIKAGKSINALKEILKSSRLDDSTLDNAQILLNRL